MIDFTSKMCWSRINSTCFPIDRFNKKCQSDQLALKWQSNSMKRFSCWSVSNLMNRNDMLLILREYSLWANKGITLWNTIWNNFFNGACYFCLGGFLCFFLTTTTTEATVYACWFCNPLKLVLKEMLPWALSLMIGSHVFKVFNHDKSCNLRWQTFIK